MARVHHYAHSSNSSSYSSAVSKGIYPCTIHICISFDFFLEWLGFSSAECRCAMFLPMPSSRYRCLTLLEALLICRILR